MLINVEDRLYLNEMSCLIINNYFRCMYIFIQLIACVQQALIEEFCLCESCVHGFFLNFMWQFCSENNTHFQLHGSIT